MSEQKTQVVAAEGHLKQNIVIAVLVDLLLIIGGVAFDFPFFLFFPVTAIPIWTIVITLVWLRRKPRFKKMFAVKFVFFLFLILTVDDIFLAQNVLYGWHPLLLLATPLAYIVALRFRGHPILQWDRVQALVAPLIVAFLLSGASDAPQSRSDCKKIARTPGVKMLYEFPSLTRVRFVLKTEGNGGYLVSHRKGFMFPMPNFVPRTLDYIDPARGTVKEWLSHGEVIGMYQAPRGGDIYSVVMETAPDFKKGESYMDLVVFSPDGAVKKRVPMPNGRSDYYTASFFPRDGGLAIFIEWNIYTYDIASGRVALVREYKDFSPYYMVQHGDSFFGVACKSPLITLTAPWMVMKYDKRSLTLTGKRRGGLFGYYDIHQAGDTSLFVASYVWAGGGILFDENLKLIKNLNIPRGTRNIGVDPAGKYIFAPNIATGMMSVLDIAKNKLLPGELFVGKGARSMNGTKDGKIILGNSCGLVEIDPAAAVKAASSSSPK